MNDKVDRIHVYNFKESLQKMMLKLQVNHSACAELLGDDFNKKDFGLMIFIGESEKAKMSDISDFMNISMSTATGMIDRLVENGYLQRENSKEDRRIVYIMFSEKGQDMYRLFEKKLDEFSESVLSLFTESEQKQFISFMERGSK